SPACSRSRRATSAPAPGRWRSRCTAAASRSALRSRPVFPSRRTRRRRAPRSGWRGLRPSRRRRLHYGVGRSPWPESVASWSPLRGERAYLTIDEVLDVARAGAAVGCREALITLGDKPELRYRVAREELAVLGCESTLEYLARAAEAVLDETGLLPHLNPGVLERQDLRELRRVSASMGLMLETASDRLSERGGPHYGSPDKVPARRL